MLASQMNAGSYEEAQRHPGDYEAQVSQRPIAVHGLEHLSETDRGVSMFRNQIRRGTRAVKAGKDPEGRTGANGVVATYCNNTVIHMPPAASEAEDKKRMRTAGMRLAKS